MSENVIGCIVDVGTGFTKLGFPSSSTPVVVVPSVVGVRDMAGLGDKPTRRQSRIKEDFNFAIGNEALESPVFNVKYPIQHGPIANWALMERYLEQCIRRKLYVDPEDYYFLVTESLYNTDDNRQKLAEIMFETFDSPGLHIASQPMLALIASAHRSLDDCSPTSPENGLVVDIGEHVTHIVPVVEGRIKKNYVKQIPLGGRHVTSFVETILLKREIEMPAAQSWDTAIEVKEQHSYTGLDVDLMFRRFDDHPRRTVFEGVNKVTRTPFSFEIGCERFLGPEVLFNPRYLNVEYETPLGEAIVAAVQACPATMRRSLYTHIALSGGPTGVPNFATRLRRDVCEAIDNLGISNENLNNSMSILSSEVQMSKPEKTPHSVFYGAAVVASGVFFKDLCRSKDEYNEMGGFIFCSASHDDA